MKNLLFWIAAASLTPAAAALAQDADNSAADRARIGAERGRVEAAFRVEEKNCYTKFAVNDCLVAAKSRRRAALSDLRRQEILLNDAERKRKGAERQRQIEERSAVDKKQPPAAGQPGKGPTDARQRETRSTDKAAEKAQVESSNAARAQARQRPPPDPAEKEAERRRRDEEAAQNLKRRQESQAQAEEHKAAVNKRLAERKKPPAQPLPVPTP